jgi:hypothetical protein
LDDNAPELTSAKKPYYLLIRASKVPKRYSKADQNKPNLCFGLIIRPTGLNKAQFERFGLFELRVNSVDDCLAYGKDPSKIPRELYNTFDPEVGFEIELV